MRRMVNEKDIALMEDLNNNNISSMTISQRYIVDNIKTISNDVLNKLKVGDIVLKNTNGQFHAYSVSFKKDDEGICLTYSDASVVETQSYDLVDGVWTYNSEDKTNLVNYTAGDNISINNGVISATDTKYTAGDNITIEDGVISASSGDIYENEIGVYAFNGNMIMRFFTKELLTYDDFQSYVVDELTNREIECVVYNAPPKISSSPVIPQHIWIDSSGLHLRGLNSSYQVAASYITLSQVTFELRFSHKIN